MCEFENLKIIHLIIKQLKLNLNLLFYKNRQSIRRPESKKKDNFEYCNYMVFNVLFFKLARRFQIFTLLLFLFLFSPNTKPKPTPQQWQFNI